MQRKALQITRTFRLAEGPGAANLRLLMLAMPGNFMANTPVEFLIEDMPVTLDIVYLVPGEPIPTSLPEHDVLLVGIAEAGASLPLLLELGPRLAVWPRPVINRPAGILSTARDRLHELLSSLPGVAIPTTLRLSRETLDELAAGRFELEAMFRGEAWPIVVRPCGTHAGNGLERIGTPTELARYLARQADPQFFVAPFVDYSATDGLFRKYRVAGIDGRFCICHMAVSNHWMVHYLNAGMAEDAGKRAEEAAAMAGFDDGFGLRHGAALSAIARALDLDYFALDCAETRDGRLLVFEAGTAMIVHRMDPPDLFPYKQAAMDKACGAFLSLLRRRATAS